MYDIYERELLAVIKALTHWQPHLAATKDPVTILTDHANLTYWKTPRTINRRVARWFTELQDYNLVIKHVPGKIHAAADMLSRPPGVDKGEDDNTDVTLLPEPIFVRLADEPDPKWTSIEERVRQEQRRQPQLMKEWRDRYQLEFVKSAMEPSIHLWKHEGKMVFPPNDELKRELLHLIHNKPTAAHVGRDWTIYTAKRVAWWPAMSKWVENYVKGCAKCQQNKTLTHRTTPPPYKINVPPTAQPFEVVAMDLITQLPNSHGHDAILTIVDHGCTRAALFLPCTTNVTGEGIAKLYLDNVYRWFGIPSKIISDRDPRFTSHFSTSLCQRLGIDRNISTAYHPQTDGLSERKNQWVEQYLRFVTSASQDDWSDWLTIATAVHNNYPNATTRIAPIEALLGYSPRITMELPYPPTTVQLVDDRTRKAMEKRKQAKEALNEAARTTPPDSYQIGDKVWLEAKHLALPYQTPKLAPKRHGPFTIIKRVSPVAYQLQLPTAWTIHDVFHASLLTPYRETLEHGDNYTRPPPDLIEDAEEYEVETIVNHRHFGRK
jgi:transposase InsO family protein